ncbi:MAG: DUF3365 domain-containing protein [Geminocystis sp.]|nr:DUF3365 domain-containing protein [Geminocystis sp.]HIK36457.1 DUF3365 domain-containing protein [Geminocystis sp. M7585_C2015_104]MCS7148991.1 DUF3365 domain-containing protein [Geminocystis sp.]MCX8077369.1 DUF3365 domain-containing protein [Geminocystis sp.]MDW8114808.1 DUF3365 domain-containing protein [Geminocystis sp.]
MLLKWYKNLKLEQKLTAILAILFVGGSIVCGVALSSFLNSNAQREIVTKGIILMNTMNSVRDYTGTEVNPLLKDRLKEEFLPQTVPAYSATEVFRRFRQHEGYENFYYKEATINPTNPRDKADAFEANIIEQFRQNPDLKIQQGFRQVGNQRVFYIARPLAVTKESCLECHSSPKIAPASLIAKYGDKGGFGWRLNEIVGSQVIHVPADAVINSARQSFLVTMSVVMAVYALVILLVNFWLRNTIVKPIKNITIVAEEVSRGDLSAEFQKLSRDEIGQLADSFNRMKTSFQLALSRLEKMRKK